MKISKDTYATARRLFRLSMEEGRLSDDRVRRIAQVIVTRQPRNYIPLLKAFTNLVSFELARRQVLVQSAIPLAETELNDIRAELVRQHGEDLVFSWEVDPAIIGGLRIRVGDRVIDGTIRNRINKLNRLASGL